MNVIEITILNFQEQTIDIRLMKNFLFFDYLYLFKTNNTITANSYLIEKEILIPYGGALTL